MVTYYPVKMTAAFMIASHTQGCNTQASVATVGSKLKLLFAKTTGLAPGILRLIFHDAGTYDPSKTILGGPTGCLADSDENKGLKRYTDLIEPILNEHPESCTRADFWALAGLLAAESLLPGDTTFDDGKTFEDGYRWGRLSEDTCDYKVGRLPGHQLNCDDSLAPLMRLGFNESEVVALMGAHSVGRTHTDVTGFERTWDDSPDTLDNNYYTAMEVIEWGRAERISMESSMQDAQDKDRFWINFTGDNSSIMMNVDVCLGFEIGNNDKNTTPVTPSNSCQVNWSPQTLTTDGFQTIAPDGSAKTCPRPDRTTQEAVKNYKDDQKDFLNDFRAAFTKLTRVGYSIVERFDLCLPCEDNEICCCGPNCDNPAPKTDAPETDAPETDAPSKCRMGPVYQHKNL